MDDMNSGFEKILTKVIDKFVQMNDCYPEPDEIRNLMSEKEREYARLYYVACSRAQHVLNNATHLLGGSSIF